MTQKRKPSLAIWDNPAGRALYPSALPKESKDFLLEWLSARPSETSGLAAGMVVLCTVPEGPPDS